MAEAAPSDAGPVRCVVVTPERAVLDKSAQEVIVTLHDGEAGFLKNHAPLVGRLGVGELRLNRGDGPAERYFIDGGFVQVQNDVVTVLTSQAIPAGELMLPAIEAEREAAEEMAMEGDTLAKRAVALERANVKQRIAGKANK